MAARCSHEEQVRHVGARNEQHEADRAGEHQQRLRHVADDRVLERRDARDERIALVFTGLVKDPRRLPLIRRNRRELRQRLLARHAVAHPADDRQQLGPIRRQLDHQRPPELRSRRVRESGRHDADDRVPNAVERDRSTDDARVGTEPIAPERVAKYHDGLATGHFVVERERTPMSRRRRLTSRRNPP